MSTMELRRLAKRNIDALPSERLRSVVDFIGYLCSETEKAPTRTSLAARMAQAKDDVAAGKLVPIAKLRRKYALAWPW